MMTQTAIRIAAHGDIQDCLGTLTRAFEADPVCLWAWPDRDAYREAFPRFCRAFGGAAFPARTAHVDADGVGVALWLPPGAAPHEEAVIELIRETAAPNRQKPLFQLFEQMEAFHPRETHWHLPLIGVDPAAQGRGIGSALLQHALRTCDEQATVAYLEATSPANVRLYERHGFEPLGRIQAGDSPLITPMARNPKH